MALRVPRQLVSGGPGIKSSELTEGMRTKVGLAMVDGRDVAEIYVDLCVLACCRPQPFQSGSHSLEALNDDDGIAAGLPDLFIGEHMESAEDGGQKRKGTTREETTEAGQARAVGNCSSRECKSALLDHV